MRWKKKVKSGAERVITRFLLFPKCLPIKGMNPKIEEWRWLETCRIRQFYAYSLPIWINWKWEDE